MCVSVGVCAMLIEAETVESERNKEVDNNEAAGS
jgi:hypothetical protein